MRFKLLAIALVTSLPLAFGQTPEERSVEALIKQLGSGDFRQRELATKALLAQPKSETALRAVMASNDAEVARRAALIVAKFEALRSPLIELDSVIKSGHIERAIELIVEFPGGKDDDALWERIERLFFEVCDRHNKSPDSAAPFKRETQPLRPRIKVARFDNGHWNRSLDESAFLVRAGGIDFSRVTGFSKQSVHGFSGVATGSVRLEDLILNRANIIARGPVNIHHESLDHCLIISCGDLTLRKIGTAVHCLIIARGAIRAPATGFHYCRVISGANATYFKGATYFSTVTENEPNPLGYIHWNDSVASGKKDAPKADSKK